MLISKPPNLHISKPKPTPKPHSPHPRDTHKQDILHLSNSFTQLRNALAKFTGGIEAIDALKTSKPNSDPSSILVPLTASLYVPGKLKDPSRVMVDVGTGYMIDQVRQHASLLLLFFGGSLPGTDP